MSISQFQKTSPQKSPTFMLIFKIWSPCPSNVIGHLRCFLIKCILRRAGGKISDETEFNWKMPVHQTYNFSQL